ncbi:MAG: DUF5711 family protein [Roseburia sp.]
MANTGKNGFRTVEMNMEEYEQKLHEHRKKIVKRTITIIAAALLVFAGTGFYFSLKSYEDYEVRSSVERSDTQATIFQEFQGNILKYSNDGAFYTDLENEFIWSQAFEMAQPALDICENYLVLYDEGGNQIYILTAEGLQGSIETTMPIQQVCVASQGTVAVLMQEDATAYLRLYDKKGNDLASGEIHGEKGGYPIALALSSDAQKLAVSMVDINDGDIKTTIAFYNFGSVGQNEIDNCVGSYSYSNAVFPEIEFVSSDRMLAFGSNEIVVFEGTQKPQVAEEIFPEEEIKSIFYNKKYFGLVTSNNDEEVTYHLNVYNMKGTSVMERDFSMEYETVEFLSNDEICIRNANSCELYTIRGIYKFHYDFEQELYQIIPGGTDRNYTFVLSEVTEKVKLK